MHMLVSYSEYFDLRGTGAAESCMLEAFIHHGSDPHHSMSNIASLMMIADC